MAPSAPPLDPLLLSLFLIVKYFFLFFHLTSGQQWVLVFKKGQIKFWHLKTVLFQQNATLVFSPLLTRSSFIESLLDRSSFN